MKLHFFLPAIVTVAIAVAGCGEDSGPFVPFGAGAGESSMSGYVYYVSKSGNDTNDGLCNCTPFLTIQKAVDSAAPGDTIMIMAGTYNESVNIGISGTEGNPILIEEYGDDDVVLDGGGELDIGISFSAADYVIVNGLGIKGFVEAGIEVDESSQHVTVSLCRVHENGINGIVGRGDLALIENNTVYANGTDESVQDRGAGGIAALMISSSVIRDNTCEDNAGSGIYLQEVENVIIEGNECNANLCDAEGEDWYHAGIWLDGGHDVDVTGNETLNNAGPGIQLSDEDSDGLLSVEVSDNTSTGNLWGIHLWDIEGTEAEPVDIMENDFSGNTTGSISMDLDDEPEALNIIIDQPADEED